MFGTRSSFKPQLQRAFLRPLPRAPSPQLHFARLNSTASKPPNFFRLTHLWYVIVGLAGASAGLALRNFAAPLALPKPGSRDDELALGALKKDLDKLDIITFLRSQCSPPDAPEEDKRGWIELAIDRHILESTDEKDNTKGIASRRTMGGSQGLGIQRAFWNSETKELVAVVWIGGGLAGWPTVAHGGAIATIFEDVMSRMVAGPHVPIDESHAPASMSVTYAQPTNVLNFYILRANFSKPGVPPAAPPADVKAAKSWLPFWKDLTKKEPHNGDEPHVEIIGTLECVKGILRVRAKGTFPVSAALRERFIELGLHHG